MTKTLSLGKCLKTFCSDIPVSETETHTEMIGFSKTDT